MADFKVENPVSIRTFFEKRRLPIDSSPDKFYTHVGLYNPRGKFNLSRWDIDSFWDMYCDKMADEKISIECGLAEKQQGLTPIMVDIDIKTKNKIQTDLYTEEQLKFIISTYQTAIKNSIQDISNENLNCVVLTKDKREEKGYFKQGIHLHFPIFVDKETQDKYIIPYCQNVLSEKKLFDSIGIEDSGKCIDDKVTSVPWLIYGCRKEGKEPYLFSKIYDYKLEIVSLEDAFERYEIFDSKEKKINIKGNVEFYLPRILSVLSFGRKEQKIKPNLKYLNKVDTGKNEGKNEFCEEPKVSTFNECENQNLDEILQNIKDLIPLLSYERSDKRDDWLKMGWILHNISSSDDYKQVWIDFSNRCPEKAKDTDFDGIWDHMNDISTKKATIKTIYYWAKTDSPDEYKVLMMKKYAKKKLIQFEGTQAKCSLAFFDLKGKDDVRVINSKTIYIWNDKIKLWEYSDKLLSLISDTLSQLFQGYQNIIIEDIKKISNDPTQSGAVQLLNERHKKIGKMVTNVQTTVYLSGIIKFYISNYSSKDFILTLDKEKYLLPIQDKKIIDLRTKEIRYRNQEDYFSFECPVSLVEDYSLAEKFILDISNGDIELKNYFQRLIGYSLSGDLSHRSMYILWGKGRNGKSTLMNIVRSIMIQFFTGLSESVFIRHERKGGATPELMPLLKSRLGVLSEINEYEKLNPSRIKSLTGSDPIQARELYQGEITFIPQTKLFMLTNEKPIFDTTDQAMMDRIKFIPFLNTFENTKENNDYVEELQTKHLNQFFSFFVEGAKLWFQTGTMGESKIIFDESNKFVKDVDSVIDFLDERCEKDENECVQAKTLYEAYRDYCLENSCVNVLSVQKFKPRMIQLGYIFHRTNKFNVWKNIKIIPIKHSINPMCD